MADLEKFKFLVVFVFEHHHFTILLKYFFPKIFKIILCIQFSLPELGHSQKWQFTLGRRVNYPSSGTTVLDDLKISIAVTNLKISFSILYLHIIQLLLLCMYRVWHYSRHIFCKAVNTSQSRLKPWVVGYCFLCLLAWLGCQGKTVAEIFFEVMLKWQQ